MGYVNTVLGPIHCEELGITANHEHVMWGVPGWEYDPKWWFNVPKIFEKCYLDLTDFRQLGGRSYVDCSGIGLGRDVNFYTTLAACTGIQIVAATGFWADNGIYNYFRNKDVDYFEKLFFRELTEGMGQTRTKAGVIKVGNISRGAKDFSQLEIKEHQAAVRAARRAGVGIITHGIGQARRQVEVLESESVDPSRVVISHADALYSIDLERDQEFAKKGFYIGYDHIGIEEWSSMPYAMPDEKRIDLVLKMLDAGFKDRIILSCDTNSWSLGWNTPKHTVGHLLRSFVPKLRSRGVSDKVINDILIENPKRFLTIQTAS
jgi:predicted metal-dependent phosphotriesterase family hydrolase